MTRTQFDDLFRDLYPSLIGHASRGLNRDDGPDLVHQVYCQIVTSAAYRDRPRGVKEGAQWLRCRVALQVKQQKRDQSKRREAAYDEKEDDDEIE